MSVLYEGSISGKQQGDGSQTILLNDINANARLSTRHQIAVQPGTATAGTLAVYVKPYGRTAFEALTRNGVAVVISIAAIETITNIPGRIEAWQLQPSGLNGTYGASVTGWEH